MASCDSIAPPLQSDILLRVPPTHKEISAMSGYGRLEKLTLAQGLNVAELGQNLVNEAAKEVEKTLIVKCQIFNDSSEKLLVDEASQKKYDGSVQAPKEVDCKQKCDFTMSPGEVLKYTICGGTFKIVFDDDKKAPKLKLSDELESKSTTIGVETTKVELEIEVETEEKTETTVTRSVGPPLPETKKSKVEKTETETATSSTETKTETKVKTEKDEAKTTVTKKTETKREEVTLMWKLFDHKSG
ncbi:hypothetical protein Dda_0116 [Drechslerella dactyloides]|uniref:Uncharacterized protein n=1 Tax=Drechslerella dactyloides TaxID=74499 RepID=A0AAD6NNY5_DREDA|nr:hypothetical protein Dda_0116 [Drechslerella dactyloides]